jgi:lantibiotic transport system ATP-binding protein
VEDRVQAAVSTQALVRLYGSRAVVDGIDLYVPSGAIYGFLGPNGAGKTTTIRMILGLIPPTSGSISVLGRSMPVQRSQILGQVGAIVETPTHYDHLTGRENLEITRMLTGLRRSEMDRVLDIVAMRDAAGERVGRYSLGMRQRLGIARALLGQPRLLILDEPTNGLDPEGIRDMRALIRDLPKDHGCTVLLCSHLLAEVEQVATHVGLMWRGRLVAQGDLAEVLGQRGTAVEIATDRPDEAQAVLRGRGFSVRLNGERLIVEGSQAPATLNALLAGAGIAVSHLAASERSLEDLYHDLGRHERLLETCA